MTKILYGGVFITPQGLVQNKALLFNEKILGFIDEEDVHDYMGEKIYFNGWILPGFIDSHIHGACGRDVMEASAEALEEISLSLLKRGITSWLPTTISAPRADIEKALKCIRENKDKLRGSRILGAYLEGPFINPDYCGAHQRAFIQKPDLWVKEYLDILKIITIAPEMDKDFNFIKELKGHVNLSIGHSGADYETALRAFDEGVGHITHCFNAMVGFHHRAPGILGAMMNRNFTVEFIADGIHIHRDLLAPLMRLKSLQNIIIVSDAMAGTFLEEGSYSLGGQRVHVKEGHCLLEDGTLAGSVHSLDKTLLTMVESTDFSLETISRMLSENPAKFLGVGDYTGSIKIGLSADLVLLKEDFQVEKVFFKGEAVDI